MLTGERQYPERSLWIHTDVVAITVINCVEVGTKGTTRIICGVYCTVYCGTYIAYRSLCATSYANTHITMCQFMLKGGQLR